MVIWTVAIFSLMWSLLPAFLLRHPDRWATLIDRHHKVFQKYGLSARWMQAAEKGSVLKLIADTPALLSLTCVAVLIKYLTALHDYLNAHSRQ